MAVLYFQFLHKIVEEVFGAISLANRIPLPTTAGTIIFAGIYVIAIILCSLRYKIGFIIGLIMGAQIILQAVTIHIIMGIPKDPIYYPVFPISQGILIIYFCRLAIKKSIIENNLGS